MAKNLIILATLAIIIALPFVFRQPPPQGAWRAGDPVLVIVTPHNEAIRYEFAQAFSKWHQEKFGKPVKVDWRNIGGTTEILRYLNSEYASRARIWWEGQGKTWPDGATDQVTNRRFPTDKAPANVDEALWKAQKEVVETFRKTDDTDPVKGNGIGIDLFFGGGEYDHSQAFRNGFTVEPFTKDELASEPFKSLIPERLSGETWRTPTVFGNAISTFGIVYNLDRLKDLGVTTPPVQWRDLAEPIYFKQVGLADPTKSGSIAKAFEMIVHQQIHASVIGAGFTDADIGKFEKAISDYQKLTPGYQRGQIPAEVPAQYQQAIERGWEEGMLLIQRIGANARYFTDAAGKVPIDVSMGDAAAGMAIDFYGRFQAQTSRAPDGSERMIYVTPVGGSSVSCDPISLLRGAPAHDIGKRFIEFVLSEEGQRLWTYKPGTHDASGKLIGPEKYALRRLPIRRDFYEGAEAPAHAGRASDPLADKTVNPYEVGKTFTYVRRWTGDHFGVQRNIIRAMCLDSGDELRLAWKRSIDTSRPLNTGLPSITLHDHKEGKHVTLPLNWRTAPDFVDRDRFDELEVMRKWTSWFRDAYAKGAS